MKKVMLFCPLRLPLFNTFGSVTRAKTHEGTDVGCLVVLDTEETPFSEVIKYIGRIAADLEATYDNNILCIAEKEILAVEPVADRLKQELLKNDCFELNRAQIDTLAEKTFQKTEAGHYVVNRQFVGRDAAVLAHEIGVTVDPSVRLLIGETDFDHLFVQEEQMMPFLPIVRVRDVEEGITLAIRAEHGYGHTALMHSRNVENMSNMAKRVNTAIFVKNGPSSAGLGVGGEGFTSFSIAGPTGEGITSARTFTRQRRCVLVDYFRIV